MPGASGAAPWAGVCGWERILLWREYRDLPDDAWLIGPVHQIGRRLQPLSDEEGRRLGLLDGSVDLGLSLLVDRLEVILSREAPLGDVALETADGVLRGPDALDLVTRTVGGAGIGHAARGVRTVKGMRAARVTYE